MDGGRGEGPRDEADAEMGEVARWSATDSETACSMDRYWPLEVLERVVRGTAEEVAEEAEGVAGAAGRRKGWEEGGEVIVGG